MAAHHHIRVESVLKVFPELSASEAHVLSRYSSGISVKNVAEELSISSKTVNTHLSNAKEKFSVSGVSELRAVYISRTLLQVFLHLDVSLERILPEFSPDERLFISLFSTGYSVRAIANNNQLENDFVSEILDAVKDTLGLVSDTDLRLWFSVKIRSFANSFV